MKSRRILESIYPRKFGIIEELTSDEDFKWTWVHLHLVGEAIVKHTKSIKRPPVKSGGFEHKCRRLKSLFRLKSCSKSLSLSIFKIWLNLFFILKYIVLTFIELISYIISYYLFCCGSNCSTKVSFHPQMLSQISFL